MKKYWSQQTQDVTGLVYLAVLHHNGNFLYKIGYTIKRKAIYRIEDWIYQTKLDMQVIEVIEYETKNPFSIEQLIHSKLKSYPKYLGLSETYLQDITIKKAFTLLSK